MIPTDAPSITHSVFPSSEPSQEPIAHPSVTPTQQPPVAPTQKPTMSPTPLDFVRVVSFHWWNAANHTYFHTLNDGDVFCRKTYKLGIEARLSKLTPITILMNGTINNIESENNSPYFSFGNSMDNGNVVVRGRHFNVGNYTIIAYPSTGSYSILGRLKVEFTVVNCS
jgi:hypothetical protein